MTDFWGFTQQHVDIINAGLGMFPVETLQCDDCKQTFTSASIPYGNVLKTGPGRCICRKCFTNTPGPNE